MLFPAFIWAAPSHFIVGNQICLDPDYIMVIRGIAKINNQPLSQADEIGIFYNNILCGAIDITQADGSFTIQVFKNECLTNGPTINSVLQVKLWDTSKNVEINSGLTLIIKDDDIKNVQGQLIWKTNVDKTWEVDIECINFTLNDVTPKQGYADEEITLTVTGSGLDQNAQVKIENYSSSYICSTIQYLDGNSVRATIPGSTLSPGTYNLGLSIGSITKTLSNIIQIQTPPIPNITSIYTIDTFEDKALNDRDVQVIIGGSNFTSGGSVWLGDTALFNLTYLGAFTIRATIPMGINPGLYPLRVINPDSRTGVFDNAFEILLGNGVAKNYGSGLHFFAYPVGTPANYKAYNFLGKYFTANTLLSFQAYDYVSQEWKISFFNEAGYPDGDNFTLSNGQGYLLYLKEEVNNIFFPGTLPYFSINLYQGINLISLPEKENYNSYQLLQDLTNLGAKVSSIHKIDQETGRNLVTFWLFDQPNGDSFIIHSDEGYFLYMNEDKLNCNI